MFKPKKYKTEGFSEYGMVWAEFFICGALLTFFAYNLCREGSIISDKTKIDEGIIGIFFLAVATSFPEIVTAGTAVFSLGKIGLGYGDIIGSIIVNLMVLFGLDWYIGKGRILSRVSGLTSLAGVFVVFILFILLGAAVARVRGVPIPSLGRMGIENILVAGGYIFYLFIAGRKNAGSKHESIFKKCPDPFLSIWAKFAFFLIIVAFLSMWMAKVAEKIVETTSLSQTFTGTLILGFTTSLPEIIVSFTALRAASVDMAVGDIIGSNLFDTLIIPFLDALTEVPIAGMLSPGQIIATVLAFLLSCVAAAGMLIKKDTKYIVNWDTGLIFIGGFMSFVLLYFIK
ncbi:MAG: hypothetical protein ABH883_03605 [Candidatus Omnitrophota bacterium]